MRQHVWTTALSEKADLQDAVSEAVQAGPARTARPADLGALLSCPALLQAARRGHSEAPTLATVFVSGEHGKPEAAAQLLDRLREAAPELTCIVGCTARAQQIAAAYL